MKTVLMTAALFVALGSAGAVFNLYLERADEADKLGAALNNLEARIAATERRCELVEQECREFDASALPKPKEFGELREKVTEVSTGLDILRTQVSALKQSEKANRFQISGLEERLRNMPASAGGSAGVRREDIEEIVEEKIKNRRPLGKEPPLSAVAARLDLEKTTRDEMERILRKKKSDLMSVLQTPRPDGTSLLDEFADELIGVMASGEPTEEEGKKVFLKFFQRIASEKLPGTDKTYLSEVLRLRQETLDAFKHALSEEQYNNYEALAIPDPLEIKIPNEPMEVYLQQRAAASGVVPGQ